MSAAKRRGAQLSRKPGPRHRARCNLKIVAGEQSAFIAVRAVRDAYSVAVCGMDGECRPVMTFRTGKEARIFAFTRARRLDVEVRT